MYMMNLSTTTYYKVANALSDTVVPMGREYLRLCFVDTWLCDDVVSGVMQPEIGRKIGATQMPNL
jgi:hypothetical protein